MDAQKIEGKWLTDLNADLSGSDRSCAVLAGAILDDRLSQVLTAYLLPSDRKGEDKLLGRGGIIEAFAARIELARRLNLLNPPMAKLLDWVREIRNDAAHKADFSFESDSVRNKVENIVSTLAIKERSPHYLTTPYIGAKGHFVASTVLLVGFLQIEAAETRRTSHQPISVIENFTFAGGDG